MKTLIINNDKLNAVAKGIDIRRINLFDLTQEAYKEALYSDFVIVEKNDTPNICKILKHRAWRGNVIVKGKSAEDIRNLNDDELKNLDVEIFDHIIK